MSHARSEQKDFKALAPDVSDMVLALSHAAAKAGIDKQLLELIKLRAALAWTEALTRLTEGVSDEVYAEASAAFSEQELAYLSSAIAAINVWNRFGVAYR